MKINQSEEFKTENNRNSVSIEINDENYKEKVDGFKNDLSHISNQDYFISIKRTFLFKIQYFKFGKTIHFYLFCSLKKNQYKLSEIPTPLFTIGPECKINNL